MKHFDKPNGSFLSRRVKTEDFSFSLSWRFRMFTSRPRLAVNPFSPNTLQRRTLHPAPHPHPLLYYMSNLLTEPISQREGGGHFYREDSFLLQEWSLSEQDWRRGTDSCVWSVIYFFIIRRREGRGPRTARLI